MATAPEAETDWVKACALADVAAAAAEHRGFHVSEGEASGITVFRARDGTVSAVETACPHAGHRLSNGHACDPADIEDLGGAGLGVLVQCPAHSYVYDTRTGVCVAAFGGGPGRAVVHGARVVGDTVHVDLVARPPADLPAKFTAEVRNRIGLKCIDLALDAKFGPA